MFVLPDLYTLYILEDYFTKLKNNPEILNYALTGYTRFTKMIEKTGQNYVKDSIEYIYDNKIRFIPGYEIDSESIPCISTLSYSGEEGQFIGDTGLQDLDYNHLTPQNQKIQPTIYNKFKALSYNNSDLIVPIEYDLISKLWRNVFIVNRSFSSQVTGMRNDGNTTILSLNKEIPTILDKNSWQSQSGPQSFIASLGASQDRVTVLIKLITSGDYSVHRLLSVILRLALKSSRMSFENAGLQIPSYSFQMPQPFNSGVKGFESTVIMNTLITDHWLSNFSASTDPGLGVTTSVLGATNRDEA